MSQFCYQGDRLWARARAPGHVLRRIWIIFAMVHKRTLRQCFSGSDHGSGRSIMRLLTWPDTTNIALARGTKNSSSVADHVTLIWLYSIRWTKNIPAVPLTRVVLLFCLAAEVRRTEYKALRARQSQWRSTRLGGICGRSLSLEV